MTMHLLQLAIGPVQEFIAAARRTRDLWFGSYLLSEISKAAARAVQANGGRLIFPAPQAVADLAFNSALNVANIVVAELPAGVEPATVATVARAAARSCWHDCFAQPVRQQFQAVIRADVWNDQVGDVVEFYAAWVPLGDDYAPQRRRLARLMAGRKNCRDFLPGRGRAGLPKSSLDGLRETVLKEDHERVRRRLRIRPGEQLDVVGLVKRTASDDEDAPVAHVHYPSVSRVAADPWLRGVVRTGGGAVLADLRQAASGLRALNRIDTQRYPEYHDFPFEGSAVYRSRHGELEEALTDDEAQLDQLSAALRAVERHARSAGLGAEPAPYVAVLVADGDRMGQAIGSLSSPDEHRRFSQHLATFAQQAGAVARECQGVLVYSGGDDVLAFVPVDRCLGCARKLHTLFLDTMRQALPGRSEADLPTLSVGIAIGHFLENLEDLLAYGRAAEKHAKRPDRNGLAVHLHKRGGGPIELRKCWDTNPDATLTTAAGWFLTQAVSNRTPYELARLAEVYDDWPPTTRAVALRADAVRVIDRKRPTGTDNQMGEIRDALQGIDTPEQLRELAAGLLIARQLAVALRQNGEHAR